MSGVVLVIILGIVGAIGDWFIKLAGSGPKYIDWRWFVLGAFVYSLTTVGWFFAMKDVKLSSIGIIYTVVTAVLLAAIGILFFHERLNTYEMVGIILAVISVILLSRFA